MVESTSQKNTNGHRSEAAHRDGLPFVSVILPVRNEGRFMELSLGAVFAQDYPPDRMEIIVADGMSTDGTRQTIESLQLSYSNLELIDNPGRIVPTGLNAALLKAHGEILVRVDGHCEIEPDYVSKCVEHLLTGNVDGVGGPVETVGQTGVAKAVALAMSSRLGVGNSAFRTIKDRSMLADTVPFPAYTRAIVERAGLYDEELVRDQDDEYNYRLRKLGAKLLLAADVKSRYYSRSSIRSLWRQYFQYGYWKVRVMQKHPRQMRWRQFVPPLFVSVLLLSLLATPFLTVGATMFALVAGSYVLANLGASVVTAGKSNWRMLPLLPFAFAALHLGYGSGFLFGLCRFWNRWEMRTLRYGDVH